MLLLFQEGQRIPLTQTHILHAGDTDNDNPIVNAITDFLTARNHGSRYAAYFCFIDEDITVYEKEIGKRVARLYTATMLEDWVRKYFNGEKVAPFTIKVYHQRNDNDEIEDERLWVGISEYNDGFNPSSLEKLYGLLSHTHIKKAYHGAILKSASNICQDYCGECPITNVLAEMTEHLPFVVCVEGEQVDFYQENKRLDYVLPFTEQLKDWVTRFEKGEQVNEGVIYINRDDTLPDQPLFIGIDYDIGNYNLVDFDKLDGMERRVTRQHIDDSLQGDCQHCVVANVLSELFRFYEINVNGSEAVIHTHGTEHAALLISERLGKWIDAYDNDGDVGTFTLIIKNLEGNEYHNYLLDIKDLTNRQKDLQNRMSRLAEITAEMELFIQKLTDKDETEFDALLREYEDLFAETVHEFGK